MKRIFRLLILLGIFAVAGYATWHVNRLYWHPEGYRVVRQGRLYVALDPRPSTLRRLHAQFEGCEFVDLSTASERATRAPLVRKTAEEAEALGAMRRIPVPEGSLPGPGQVRDFLRFYGRGRIKPVVLLAGGEPTESPQVRCAAMEAAFHCHVLGKPLSEALEAVGLKGTPFDEPLRGVLAESVHMRGPGTATHRAGEGKSPGRMFPENHTGRR